MPSPPARFKHSQPPQGGVKPVIVIGAGIIGACIAAYLQRDGHAVTLIDHAEPGSGASLGNGGMLSGSSIIPVAMPGVAAKVPGWLMDTQGPLTIRWGYLPALVPWLWRFLAAARPAKVEAQATALRALLAPSGCRPTNGTADRCRVRQRFRRTRPLRPGFRQG